MFEHCRAFIIATNPHETRALELTAHQLGFAEVVSSLGGARLGPARAAITYFFLDYRMSDDDMLDVIEAVREERSSQLRYSPMILFTDHCPIETKLKYVRFGFDDVISLPEQRDAIAERLAEQLHNEQVYFEANNYLGPDRRRMDHGAELRVAIATYTRLVFRRDPRRGIRVLDRELRGHRFKAQPDPNTHFMPKFFGHLVG